MSAPKDDLEAVRAVVDAIKDFKPDEQQLDFLWVAEKSAWTTFCFLGSPTSAARNTPRSDASRRVLCAAASRRKRHQSFHG